MNKNMFKLIREIKQDEWSFVNKQIESKIFTVNDVADAAIEYHDSKYIYFVALYVPNVPIDRLADTIIKT